MQKILFDKANAQAISAQATDICNIFNQLSNEPIHKVDLLNAFAKVFGYKSGWPELMAVNKSTRFYVPFSISVCSHMRAIIKSLSKFLPLHVDPELLLVAVSFTELGVENLKDHHRYQSAGELDAEKYVLWFTKSIDTPQRHLAKSPSAALLERRGIRLEHFAILWPELYSYLKNKFELSPEWILLFNEPVWWSYGDRFVADYRSTEIGQWEIHFKGSKSSKRICYEPIYDDDNGELLGEIATVFSEGLCGCPRVEHFGEDMADDDYILACLEYLKTMPHILDIKFSLRKDHSEKLISPPFSFLKKYLTDHNEIMDLVKNRVTNMDFTEEIWGFEPRFLYNEDGSQSIYQESWIIVDEIQKFIDVNEEIHLYAQNFNRLNLLNIGHLIEAYKKEKFSSLLSQ